MTFKGTTKNSGYLIALFFILNTFINVVKFDNDLYFPSYYTHYSDQAKIELVVSEQTECHLNLNKLNPAPKQVTDFAFAAIDFLVIHKYQLIQYQNYILIQIKSFIHSFIPNQQFIAILQTLWHHSSYFLSN